ncbi:MAG TPA: hypothetical protein PLU67_05820 [Candidatus Kapabacteria bacterium]|jgi:outer membrane lipopolysaccharide assembly protein LptE/RlpB|nr:hypothetical protein [Candidatus Kapabacteria bacterium]HOQ48948.1 hypothetical protein [Candidatus Kapabacteria bacterium]HPP39088.1 hypothetical protein [Candidatus Kapabacteria bacterium]HPU22874.1 hypothetical protein [Candidatus Kapabacteria bacterium]
MAKVIAVEDIQDGMIIAEPIVNRYGQVLLAAGVVLSQQHSTFLKTWNIRTIKVTAGAEDEETSEISEEMRKQILESIAQRTSWTPRIPIEEDLFKVAVYHLAKKMSHTEKK